MAGRPRDPTRAKRGTGHRAKPGESTRAKPVVRALPPPPEDETEAAAELVPAERFPPPEDLAEAIVPLWRSVISELEPRGLHEADLESIRHLCVHAHRAREAGRLVSEHGFLVQGARGPMVNPAIRAERDATMAYQRLAAEFALTLASRMRLGLMQLAGESLLASLNRDLDADYS